MVSVVAALVFALVQPAGLSPSVIFVCEHGAAKSVIATAYFNKLAAERGLPDRATFRGTTPQDELSARAVAGLKADNLAVPSGKPAAISEADVSTATHIFAIGCTLPAAAARLVRDLVARDVQAIVCCSTAAASRAARTGGAD